jgi:hypothetical protein
MAAACLKVKSNNEVSWNMLIRVQTKNTAANHVDSIAAWIARVAAETCPVEDGWCPHMVVAGTLHNNWPGDDVCNEIVVAVRESLSDTIQGSYFNNSTYDGLVVCEERKNPAATLNAQALARAMEIDLAKPTAVVAAGVSGVSDSLLAEVWREIVSAERNWMDGGGEGQLVHPMWMWSARRGAYSSNETSFNFGWGVEHDGAYLGV